MGDAAPLAPALLRIASYLCSAYDELTTMGLDDCAGHVLSVLTAIDGRIAEAQYSREERFSR